MSAWLAQDGLVAAADDDADASAVDNSRAHESQILCFHCQTKKQMYR